ncbi:MAG: type II secretion system protein GspN [Myxococcota bacterium]|nr:type II secretion system protein GspN [Myxococcota bacterium]
MKKFVTKLFKGLAYIMFFVCCFTVFLYGTAPIDEAKALLIRTASDTFDYNLEIAELALPTATSVRMDGVVLTRRPSPEELEQIKASRVALKAWKERQTKKKDTPESDSTETTKDSTATKGKTDSKDTKPAIDKNRVPPIEAVNPKKGETESAAKDSVKKTSTTKKDTGKEASDTENSDPKPKLVRGPMPVSIDYLEISVDLPALLNDVFDGKIFNEAYQVNIQSRLMGGQLKASLQRATEALDIKIETSELDIAQIHELKPVLEFPLIGTIGLNTEIAVPINGKGKLQVVKSTGNIDVSVTGTTVGPGQFDSPKLRGFGPVDVPKIKIQSLGGTLALDKRRARLKGFKIKGPDLIGELDGYIKLTSRLKDLSADIFMGIKMSDAFKKTNRSLASAQKTIPILKRATNKDGYMGFTAKGRFSKLRWSPKKENPHARRKTRRAKKASRIGKKTSRSASKIKSRKNLNTRKGTLGNRSKPRSNGIKTVDSTSRSKGNSNPDYKSKSGSRFMPKKPSSFKSKSTGYRSSNSDQNNAEPDDDDDEGDDEEDDEESESNDSTKKATADDEDDEDEDEKNKDEESDKGKEDDEDDE